MSTRTDLLLLVGGASLGVSVPTLFGEMSRRVARRRSEHGTEIAPVEQQRPVVLTHRLQPDPVIAKQDCEQQADTM